jgi:environmental stress-induced protein Ves
VTPSGQLHHIRHDNGEIAMEIIQKSDLAEVPWKNGGGITREIAIAKEQGELLWRLSMADVTVDGPFSNFGGLMRILTVIKGNGMDLISSQGILSADLNRPVRFDGALKIDSKLKDGPIQDLNLIFNPLHCGGEVMPIKGPYRKHHDADSHIVLGVHCAQGVVGIGDDTHLHPGDTALISSGTIQLKLDEAASAMLVMVTNAIDQA